MVMFQRVSHIVGTGLVALSLIACGADTRGNDAGPRVDSGANPPLNDSGTNTGSDSGPGVDAGGSGGFDSGFTGFDAGPGGSTGMSYNETIDGVACFTLGTGVVSTDSGSSSCTGDLEFTVAFNVDIWSSDFQNHPALCVMGAANSLADISNDYSNCSWEVSVDGTSGLTNRGFIVRDVTETHHYRFHVQSNTESTLVFSYDTID